MANEMVVSSASRPLPAAAAQAQVVRESFSGQELEAPDMGGANALAVRAKAEVEARFIMAARRPRDFGRVRQRVLAECSRRGFAERARYVLPPRGKDPDAKPIEGWSIRFAESLARNLGNIDRQAAAIYDDAERRVIRVTVTDLETNYAESRDVVVTKQVERRFVRQGQEVLSSRTNSDGKKVYTVAATDQEILERTNSLVARAARTALISMAPADLLDDAMAAIQHAMAQADADDPGHTAILEAFASIGVSRDQIEGFIGHPMAEVNERDRGTLRGLYAAIRDGETTWDEATGAKASESAPATRGAAAVRKAAEKEA